MFKVVGVDDAAVELAKFPRMTHSNSDAASTGDLKEEDLKDAALTTVALVIPASCPQSHRSCF